MGRSVSVPASAVAVAYQEFDGQDEMDWDLFIDDIKDSALWAFPKMSYCDHWAGREDHAILENQLAYLGVSEYCGLVAVWLVPKLDGYSDSLAVHWCNQQAPRLQKLFGTLNKIGTFSNGEAVFERV
jgi:hypothetical protein